MHRLTRHWVLEPYLLCMQVKAVRLGTIELVTLDGTAQAVGVGTVDAQLVGASCLGVEGDEFRV